MKRKKKVLNFHKGHLDMWDGEIREFVDLLTFPEKKISLFFFKV